MHVVPWSDLRDWLARARAPITAIPCLLRPLVGSKRECRGGFRLLLAIVAGFGLLGITGCAGGFQGARPEALTGPAVMGPTSQTVMVGQTATFTVTASGSGPLTYQWYKNGVAISGATSSTYTTPGTVAGDNGAVFTVVVSNAAGSVTSGPATLTVQSPAPLAKSIVPSNATPPYNAAVMLIP